MSQMSPNQDLIGDSMVPVMVSKASTEIDQDHPVMRRNDQPRKEAIPGPNKL